MNIYIPTDKKILSKIERHFARHMLAWSFGDFKGGEIFPLRNCPRAKPPPLPACWLSIYLLDLVRLLLPPNLSIGHRLYDMLAAIVWNCCLLCPARVVWCMGWDPPPWHA